MLDGTHPCHKSLAEMKIDDGVETDTRAISLEDIAPFAQFTGDTFYAHTDPVAAAASPLFGGIVAHGLVVSLTAGPIVEPHQGSVLANFGVDNLRFLTPVKAGNAIKVHLTRYTFAIPQRPLSDVGSTTGLRHASFMIERG